MRSQLEQKLIHQCLLLRCAVANRIDKNPHVAHINYNEILEWIDRILEMCDQ